MYEDLYDQWAFPLMVLAFILYWGYHFYRGVKINLKEREQQKEEMQRRVPLSPPEPITSSRKKAPRVPRVVKDSFTYKTPLSNFKKESPIDARNYQTRVEKRNLGKEIEGDVISSDMKMEDYSKAYDIVVSTNPSRAKELLASLPDKKRMILIHELFSRPKGLR
jgi:hypothetical protein